MLHPQIVRSSETPSPPPKPGSAGARLRRPWYLIATMCLMWLFGVVYATGGCSNVSYLRGSQELPNAIAESIQQQSHPLVRASLVREKARLEAFAASHERAFPLSVGKLLLGLLLVFAAGAALAGRRNVRKLALHAVAANALLALVSYGLLGPTRLAMAQAVAVETVAHAEIKLNQRDREATIETQREIQLEAEVRVFLLELCAFGAAALALSRRRTKAYFKQIEATVDDQQGSDSPPP